VPAQLGDHTVRAASTPVRDGKGIPLSLKLSHYDDKAVDFSQDSRKNSVLAVESYMGAFQMG